MIEGIIFDVDGTLIRTETAFIERTLRKTIEKLGEGYFNRERVPPWRVLYVGDSHNDLLGSRNAGMSFAWMNRGEHKIYGTPNRELKTLRELS